MSQTDESVYDYFARLNIEGKRNIWVGNQVKINYVYKKIERYIKNARTACEVGVGEGYLLRLLYNYGLEVVGVDISKYLVNHLRNKFYREGLDIELIQGDVSKVKLEKGKFDLIFCLDVLEHIPDVKKAIENIKKGLSDGGLLIGTLPLNENLYDNVVICPKCHHKFHRLGHCHSFSSVKEIKKLLGSEFKILQIGEVKNFINASDIINYIIQKILRLAFRKKISRTAYFVAKLIRNH